MTSNVFYVILLQYFISYMFSIISGEVSFPVLFLYFSGKKENFGINDAVVEQNVTILQK